MIPRDPKLGKGRPQRSPNHADELSALVELGRRPERYVLSVEEFARLRGAAAELGFAPRGPEEGARVARRRVDRELQFPAGWGAEALRDVAREVALSDDAEFAACLWEARREFTLLGFLRPSPPAWRGPEAGDLLVLRWNLDDGVLADVAQPRLRGFGAGVELDRPYRDAEEWLRVASRPGGPLRPLPGRERALEPWAWL